MRALVMSVKGFGCRLASRTNRLARAGAASIANLRRTATSKIDHPRQACAASILSLRRAMASRTDWSLRAWTAPIVQFGRLVVSRAEGPARAWTAPVIRIGHAVASHTEGARAQAYLAFTLTFVLATVVGSIVFPPGARRTAIPAPPLVQPESTVSIATVAPRVEPLAAQPSIGLPRLPEPPKRGEETVRVVNAAVSAGHAQTPGAAVRSGGAPRSEVAKVTAIALWGSPSKPWVSITASAPVRYQLRNVEPDWVVIDVSRAELALTSGRPPAGRGLVRLIRVGQFAPNVVRVVLELTQAVPIHVATSPGKNAIVVSLAADARGNRHSVPAPPRLPGAAKPFPAARAVPGVPGT